MKMHDVLRTGLFKQVIDILGDKLNALCAPGSLPCGENLMRFVGACVSLLANSFVIEAEDCLAVAAPCREVTDFVDACLGPDAISGAKR
jgi:hypothetical protein